MTARSESYSAISQTTRAVLGIRDLVSSGSLPVGKRVSETAIADMLELSRTPVRAALARLEQEGLLEPIETGGYAVRGFSEADVRDAIELRGVLEGAAARLAAERGVSGEHEAQMRRQLERLETVLATGAETFDIQAYDRLNREFHDTLRDACRSEIVAAQIERISCLPFAGPSAFVGALNDVPAFRDSLLIGHSQHEAILEAIVGREGARAEAMTREHARLALFNLNRALRDKEIRQGHPALVLLRA